jgi:hypothetical protein
MLFLSQGYRCPKSLPQDVLKKSPCYKIRQWSLEKQQKTFGIKPPTKTMPFARFDIGIKEFLAFLIKNPFLRNHAGKWLAQAVYNEGMYKVYKNMTSGSPSIMTMPEFSFLVYFFKAGAKKFLDVSSYFS